MAAPAVHMSVDRAFLPGEGGDAQPVVHLAFRDAREVEITLRQEPDGRRALLGLPSLPSQGALSPAPARVVTSMGRQVEEDYADLWRSLSPAGRAAAREILGLGRPLGAALRLLVAEPDRGTIEGTPPLRAWRLPVEEPGWNYADLDLGALPAGVFRIEARTIGPEGPRSASLFVIVTRLALLAERVAGGTSILAEDAVDGRPMPGVELYSTGSPETWIGKTGEGGLFSTPGPITGTVVGSGSGQVARITLEDAVSPEPTDREAGAVFVDRPAYHAGETTQVWALLRVKDAGTWKIPEAQDATVELLDRWGRLLLRRPVEISVLGVVAASLPLPAGLAPGWYTVAVQWEGPAGRDERRAADLRIDGGAPHELAARWETHPWVAPGEAIEARLHVADRLGRGEPGVAVRWRAQEEIPAETSALHSPGDEETEPSGMAGEGRGVTGPDGNLVVSLPGSGTVALLSLRAEATDPAGRTATAAASVFRAPAPVLLALAPQRRIVRPGHAAVVAVEARTIAGEPFRGYAILHVRAVENGAAGETVRVDLGERTVALDGHGNGSAVLPPVPAGYLEVGATVAGDDLPEGGLAPRRRTDAGPPLARTSIFVTENGGDIPTTPDRLELVLDRVAYERGDEVRALVMTPFDSGRVLVGMAPGAGPPDQVLAVHGYSGLVRLHGVAGGRIVAAALSGGTIFAASATVPIVSAPAPLSLHLAAPVPLRAGQKAALTLSAVDRAGRGTPAALEVIASTENVPAPSLDWLLSPEADLTPIVAASTGSGASSAGGEEEAMPRRSIVPYGPSRIGVDEEQEPRISLELPDAVADDQGRASVGLRVPNSREVQVRVRAVAGPDLFAERSWTLPVAARPEVELGAPPWVRPGDRFAVVARLSGRGPSASGCLVVVQPGNATLARDDCREDGTRVIEAIAGRGGAVLLSGSVPLLPRGMKAIPAHAVLPIEPDAGPLPANAGELARALTAGLAGVPLAGDRAELFAAAASALGALPEEERAQEGSPVVARLEGEEDPSGGFGRPEGELARDAAALIGLVELSEAGVPVDDALLERTRRRVESLHDLAAEPEHGRAARALEVANGEARGRGHRRPRPLADGSAIAGEPAAELVRWLADHRPRPPGGALLAGLLAAQAEKAAGPLEIADVVAALAQLDPETAVAWTAPPVLVTRRYRIVERSPWTEALLDADEEPTSRLTSPVAGPLPLGAEVEVDLSAEIGGPPRVACLRDFPPAGLAPIGASAESPALLLCGRSDRGKLHLSYPARALFAGRYAAPGPSLGVASPPGRVEIVEIAP